MIFQVGSLSFENDCQGFSSTILCVRDAEAKSAGQWLIISDHTTFKTLWWPWASCFAQMQIVPHLFTALEAAFFGRVFGSYPSFMPSPRQPSWMSDEADHRLSHLNACHHYLHYRSSARDVLAATVTRLHVDLSFVAGKGRAGVSLPEPVCVRSAAIFFLLVFERSVCVPGRTRVV